MLIKRCRETSSDLLRDERHSLCPRERSPFGLIAHSSPHVLISTALLVILFINGLGCDSRSDSEGALHHSSEPKSASDITLSADQVRDHHGSPALQNRVERLKSESRDLISRALTCDVKRLTQCQAWTDLIARYALYLRQVKINAPFTYQPAQIWFRRSSELLYAPRIESQILGVKLLVIGAKRLKYRVIPDREKLSEQTRKLIEREVDSLHQARLLSLLHELTPPRKESVFTPYIGQEYSPEVQERAWRIIATRHSPNEPISLKQVKRAIRQEPTVAVRASIIRAASLIKAPQVVKWCGSNWWQTKLYQDCRDALTSLKSKRATLAIWRWVDALFNESDQALNSDQVIAEALVCFSRGKFTPRLKRRYLNSLDQFFRRRRSEKATLIVARSWLQLRPKRFAREVILRYLKPNQAKAVPQSYVFTQQLRELIHRLGGEASSN